MNNLAGTLRARGDLKGARQLQDETLNIRRRVLGRSTLVHPPQRGTCLEHFGSDQRAGREYVAQAIERDG